MNQRNPGDADIPEEAIPGDADIPEEAIPGDPDIPEEAIPGDAVIEEKVKKTKTKRLFRNTGGRRCAIPAE